MDNINSVLLKAKNYLINNSIKSANIDSEILMCNVLKKSREYLILNTLDKIDDDIININTINIVETFFIKIIKNSYLC